ncbi:hypothetical protein JCM21900_006313 [Sporobolomyces salmonicolor]
MYHDADAPRVEDDSPWLDDEPAPQHTVPASAFAPNQISQQEWDKLSQRYSDAGYRDGITAGKNSKLQAGFDEGFALAAPYARELGALRGIAANLLSILTTAGGAKLSSSLVGCVSDPSAKDRVVGELRELVNALGKLDAVRILPVDREADEHARSHADEGISQELRERREMREMEALLGGLGGEGAAGPESGGVEECRRRLESVLEVFGMTGVLPPPSQLHC